MIFDKKDKKLLKGALGTPLAYGTMTYVGGSLPGTMGTTMTSALSGAAPMVGVVSKVGFLGVALNTTKKAFNINKSKRLKI